AVTVRSHPPSSRSRRALHRTECHGPNDRGLFSPRARLTLRPAGRSSYPGGPSKTCRTSRLTLGLECAAVAVQMVSYRRHLRDGGSCERGWGGKSRGIAVSRVPERRQTRGRKTFPRNVVHGDGAGPRQFARALGATGSHLGARSSFAHRRPEVSGVRA